MEAVLPLVLYKIGIMWYNYHGFLFSYGGLTYETDLDAYHRDCIDDSVA